MTAVWKRKTAKKNGQATLKFEFGWKNWIPGRGFVQQKKNSGGGTRSYNVPRQATLDDCQEIAMNLFFPNGMSPVGPVDEMNIAMGNFSGEFLIFMQDGGKPLQFTAEKYKQITGFVVPRIYLLPGQRKALAVIKCRLFLSFFQRLVSRALLFAVTKSL